MPRVPLAELPDDARLWIFGATGPLDPAGEERLLDAVDRFLDGWAAHGSPLTAARDWRQGRFLLVAVDQASVPPSGCSIDALVRTLKELEGELGVGLVGHAPIWFRDGDEVRSVSRPEFRRMAEEGRVGPETTVYDPTPTRLGEVREGRWERPARESWHGRAFLAGR